MIKFVAFATLLVCATAAPASVSTGGDDTTAQITDYTSQVNPDGTYAYKFATSNGISIQEGASAAGTAQGTFQYSSPEGEPIQVNWQADEGGFRPTGAHLPTPPPIPEVIQRALDYIAAHPPPPEAETKTH